MNVKFDSEKLFKEIEKAGTTRTQVRLKAPCSHDALYGERMSLLTAARVAYFLGIGLEDFVVHSKELDLLKFTLGNYEPKEGCDRAKF